MVILAVETIEFWYCQVKRHNIYVQDHVYK